MGLAGTAASSTVAWMVIKLKPLAVAQAPTCGGGQAGVAVTETLPTVTPTTPPPLPTEYPAEAVNPLADAVTYVACGVAAAACDRVAVATPLELVKAVVGLNDPKVASVLKVTTSFAIGAPLAFFKVAFTVAETLVEIEFDGERAIVKVAVLVPVVPVVPGMVPEEF
jgi:hypothetical protein